MNENSKAPTPSSRTGVPEGWQLVPKEPIAFMISRGVGCDWRRGDDTIRNIWRHMLDAVGQPQCPTCEGTGKEGRHSICRDCDEGPTPVSSLGGLPGLIERLREPAEDDVPVRICRLMDEAADEIERLRDANSVVEGK